MTDGQANNRQYEQNVEQERVQIIPTGTRRTSCLTATGKSTGTRRPGNNDIPTGGAPGVQGS
ncbi:hypothetical protein Deipe_3365 [Deinococcus peraridilitoris DSM 19664]|uniref:Uncharacterized protein n=1 Tax=Deinococcus peraridilitoris (strain DSM 19664 / LMG 22246 / CIP 109416 / KR-200) TaxID=937777 RepID=L0A6X9_DEIPD|nr:hypothetical protein Deipe_3365 [Deinococcus peraridilitoris DSM 19664]